MEAEKKLTTSVCDIETTHSTCKNTVRSLINTDKSKVFHAVLLSVGQRLKCTHTVCVVINICEQVYKIGLTTSDDQHRFKKS